MASPHQIAPPSSVAPRWRSEPFRVFFPLGVLLGWGGVAQWVLYAAGAAQTYSCFRHGLLQIQTFLMAFAVGFLLTAIPRRTASAPASGVEVGGIAAALLGAAVALQLEAWIAAEVCELAVFALLLQFAVRRFLGAGAGRRPPAPFVMVPLGMLDGVVGGVLLIARAAFEAPPWTLRAGQLLIEQGVFLSFVIGVGGLVLPLMAGATPPPDLGSSPAVARQAALYALGGLLISASFALDVAGFEPAGELIRGAVAAIGLAWGAGAHRRPGKTGLHRRLVWLACRLVPLGLFGAALLPSYRVPALHVMFIGGFGLMVYGVATHVVLSHLGYEAEALGRPRAVKWVAAGILLALCARLAADLSHTYFDHLAWAAGLWIVGTGVWLADALRRIASASAADASRPTS